MRLEPESNSSVPQATESAIIGQNLQPSTLRESPESAESATKETQTTARTTPIVVLQALRRKHEFGSDPYRILDAAICHLLGSRVSSVGLEYDEEAL